jgi:hypothetical protein
MIDSGAVIAYERNKVQMIRVPNNQWDNKTTGVLVKEVGGVSQGRLANGGLNELSSFFEDALNKFGICQGLSEEGDDMIPGFEILMPGDPRVRSAHASGRIGLGNIPFPMDLGSTVGTLHFHIWPCIDFQLIFFVLSIVFDVVICVASLNFCK